MSHNTNITQVIPMQISEECRKTVELVRDQIMSARSRNEYYETEPGNRLLELYPNVIT